MRLALLFWQGLQPPSDRLRHYPLPCGRFNAQTSCGEKLLYFLVERFSSSHCEIEFAEGGDQHGSGCKAIGHDDHAGDR